MRLHAVVHGRVQGVGYRASVHTRIKVLPVTGYVKNLPDGTVEIVAEGAQADLNHLLDIASEGSLYSNVTGIDSKLSQPTGEYASFEIAR